MRARLVWPADWVAMQDDVDGVENRITVGNQRCDRLAEKRNRNGGHVEKARAIFGAIDRDVRGQNINVTR